MGIPLPVYSLYPYSIHSADDVGIYHFLFYFLAFKYPVYSIKLIHFHIVEVWSIYKTAFTIQKLWFHLNLHLKVNIPIMIYTPWKSVNHLDWQLFLQVSTRKVITYLGGPVSLKGFTYYVQHTAINKLLVGKWMTIFQHCHLFLLQYTF